MIYAEDVTRLAEAAGNFVAAVQAAWGAGPAAPPVGTFAREAELQARAVKSLDLEILAVVRPRLAGRAGDLASALLAMASRGARPKSWDDIDVDDLDDLVRAIQRADAEVARMAAERAGFTLSED